MPNVPHWLIKILAEPEDYGVTSKPGSVVHTEVLHDACCDRLNGRGPCNCDPDIRRIPSPSTTQEGR